MTALPSDKEKNIHKKVALDYANKTADCK
jgi:hypothetical protein